MLTLLLSLCAAAAISGHRNLLSEEQCTDAGPEVCYRGTTYKNPCLAQKEVEKATKEHNAKPVPRRGPIGLQSVTDGACEIQCTEAGPEVCYRGTTFKNQCLAIKEVQKNEAEYNSKREEGKPAFGLQSVTDGACESAISKYLAPALWATLSVAGVAGLAVGVYMVYTTVSSKEKLG
jgi:hypothetical protein